MRSLVHEVDVVAAEGGTTIRLAHRLGVAG
jgi:hypothetical protein